MQETLNFPIELIRFPLHADIACCGKYSSETYDFDPDIKLPDRDFPESIMSLATFEEFVAHYSDAQIHSDIHYYWRGGDPLLAGVDFFQRAVELEKQYAEGVKVYNHVHTPGGRINEEWCRFFADNGFEVSIEMDGDEETTERFRHTVALSPQECIRCHSTPETRRAHCTERKLETLQLLQTWKVEHFVEVPVCELNGAHPLETYRYLLRQGVRRMRFVPVVVRSKGKLSPHCIEAQCYGKFLVDIFDYWIRHDVGSIEIFNFEETLQGAATTECHFAPTCGHHAYLAPDGTIYSCRYYTASSDALGTLKNNTFTGLLYGRKQLRFGAVKQNGLTTQCRECTYLPLCHGGCPRHRYALSDSGQKGHPYLCSAYRMYFDHVLIPLKYLAEELRLGHDAARMKTYYE